MKLILTFLACISVSAFGCGDNKKSPYDQLKCIGVNYWTSQYDRDECSHMIFEYAPIIFDPHNPITDKIEIFVRNINTKTGKLVSTYEVAIDRYHSHEKNKGLYIYTGDTKIDSNRLTYYVSQNADLCIPNDSSVTTTMVLKFHPVDGLSCDSLGTCAISISKSLCPKTIILDSIESHLDYLNKKILPISYKDKDYYDHLQKSYAGCITDSLNKTCDQEKKELERENERIDFMYHPEKREAKFKKDELYLIRNEKIRIETDSLRNYNKGSDTNNRFIMREINRSLPLIKRDISRLIPLSQKVDMMFKVRLFRSSKPKKKNVTVTLLKGGVKFKDPIEKIFLDLRYKFWLHGDHDFEILIKIYTIK